MAQPLCSGRICIIISALCKARFSEFTFWLQLISVYEYNRNRFIRRKLNADNPVAIRPEQLWWRLNNHAFTAYTRCISYKSFARILCIAYKCICICMCVCIFISISAGCKRWWEVGKRSTRKPYRIQTSPQGCIWLTSALNVLQKLQTTTTAITTTATTTTKPTIMTFTVTVTLWPTVKLTLTLTFKSVATYKRVYPLIHMYIHVNAWRSAGKYWCGMKEVASETYTTRKWRKI